MTDNAFPKMKMHIRSTNSFFCGILCVNTVRIGAPTATPSAYPVMSCPACGMLTFRSVATLGNKPIMINSVMPMANAPIVKHSSDRGNGFLYLIVKLVTYWWMLPIHLAAGSNECSVLLMMFSLLPSLIYLLSYAKLSLSML